MQITILGSGGGVGIPNPFCTCKNCEAARRAGGKSLRDGPAVLINRDLLIDCGPDVVNSVRRLGISLGGLRTLVITHRHSDHLDPWFFWHRSRVDSTDLPLLTVYAPQDALDYIFFFYRDLMGWSQTELETRTRILFRPTAPGMMKLAGRYRLHFFPATHGDESLQALLVGVKDVRSAYLHCYDTGPLGDAAWAGLAGHRFDVAALDACIGMQEGYVNPQHMTGPQTIAHAAMMRERGILTPDGVALATHFVHQAPGLHDDLIAYYQPHGVDVAYDGLVLMPGEDDAES